MRLVLTLVFILLTLHLLPAQAQSTGLLSHLYIPPFTTGSIQDYINDVEQQTKVSVSFSKSSLNTEQKVTITGNEKTVGEVLTAILANEKVTIKERKNKILLVPIEKRSNKPRFITINGYVKEQNTKEVLIGAAVFVPELKMGTVTNTYGYYSLTVPVGNYRVVCAYIGYENDTSAISITEAQRLDISLSLQNALQEVTVTSGKEAQTQHIRLSYADIVERPGLLGENDVMRALQNQTGVTSGTEGSGKVLVRGGEPGQNLNLIDGVPLYFVDHFFGFTSIFNAEAIKNVDFHKGAFPSRYGGRVSSIIDISTKDGDMEHWGGQFSMGLVKGSANLEGPIIKNKSSIMVSVRRTWLDALWRFSSKKAKETKFDFYDVNAKANYILNKNNRLYLSIYSGRDQIKVDPTGNQLLYTRWGNSSGAVKWNSIINPKLFLNTTLTYSHFKFSLLEKSTIVTDSLIVDIGGYTGTSTVEDIAATSQATWYPNSNNRIEMGIHYSRAYFVPVEVSSYTTSLGPSIRPFADKFVTNELSVFAEDEIKLNNRWTIRPGMHLGSWFNNTFKYSSLQPRLYTAYKLAPSHTLYASFSQMAQFIHLINNNTYGLPSDFWIPSTSNIEPEESYMATIGYHGIPGKNLNYSVELYYKDTRNITTYSMGKDLFDNSKNWEDNIVQGNGNSYGAEFSLKEKAGSFRFRLAYTLSWSWRQFAAFNDGKPFPYRYDRRHNIKAAVIYKPSKKFDMSANWTFMSGEAITLPDQVYPDLDANLLVQQNNYYYSSAYTYNYVEWNNFRLPPIHRLDLAMNFTKTKGKRMERIWSVGVYNAYMRQNVMFVTLENDGISGGGFKLRGLALLQFIPFVNYQLKF